MSAPEAMDWEEKYRAGDMPWDHGEAAPPLLEALECLPRSHWGDGWVLVPGCGTGHDVRALAAAGLRALGLDLAPTAIEMARAWPVIGPERYLAASLFDPAWRADWEVGAVWEHTCFCALPPEDRPRYAAAVAALLAPGQHLIGVFYLDPEPRDDGLPGPPFRIGRDELIAFWAEAGFEWVDGWVPRRAYPSRVGREWLAVFRRKETDGNVA